MYEHSYRSPLLLTKVLYYAMASFQGPILSISVPHNETLGSLEMRLWRLLYAVCRCTLMTFPLPILNLKDLSDLALLSNSCVYAMEEVGGVEGSHDSHMTMQLGNLLQI